MSIKTLLVHIPTASSQLGKGTSLNPKHFLFLTDPPLIILSAFFPVTLAFGAIHSSVGVIFFVELGNVGLIGGFSSFNLWLLWAASIPTTEK